MPSLVIGGSLPERTREIIPILLIIFVAVVVGAIIAYAIAKLINLYREHKYNQALARKALDIEACMIMEVERNSTQKLAHPTSKLDFSLVPSFPPNAHIMPHRTDFHDRMMTSRIVGSFSPRGDVRRSNIDTPLTNKFYAPPLAASQQSGKPFSWSSEGFSRYPSLPVCRPRTEASPTVSNSLQDHHNQIVRVESRDLEPSLHRRQYHSDSHIVASSREPRLATAVEGGATVGGSNLYCSGSAPASTTKIGAEVHAKRETIEENIAEPRKHNGNIEVEAGDSSLAYLHQE